MAPRFGTDGIRGVAGVELTAEIALGLGRAAARLVAGSPFLLGRDTRRSGTMLQAALSAGLAAEGADVLDVGIIPTPGLAWLARERGAPAAMVSASHNPFADNGIKLLGPGGAKLATALEVAIQDELDRLNFSTGTHESPGLPGASDGPRSAAGAGIGVLGEDPGALEDYIGHLVQIATDWPQPGLEIVVDCANGAASAVAPAVFERAGIGHRVLFAEPDGVNINAGCGSTHLGPLQAEVVASGAAFGVAFDGDADRMLAVDHTGAIVDGDHLLALFAADLAAHDRLTGGRIVATVMSNLGLRRALAERGIGLVETPVGDRHVTDAIEAEGLVLGGEQSGHLVFREHAVSGDGILTALLLCDLVNRAGRPLARLASEAMSRFPQELRNVAVPDPSRLTVAPAVWDEVSAVEAELGSSGRVLLRASGTEALVRVMVEAPSHEAAGELADRLVAVVRRELGTTGGLPRP